MINYFLIILTLTQVDVMGSPMLVDPPASQCDRMDRLFFNIWPFTLMTTCPLAYKISQSWSKILPNSQYALKKLPKTFKILHKSGHTAPSQQEVSIRQYFNCNRKYLNWRTNYAYWYYSRLHYSFIEIDGKVVMNYLYVRRKLQNIWRRKDASKKMFPSDKIDKKFVCSSWKHFSCLYIVFSVTRLVDFFNFLMTNFLTRVAQIIRYIFGLF